MKEIKLIGIHANKRTALVDDEDYDRVNKFRWYVTKLKRTDMLYANVTTWENGKRKDWSMHRFILGIRNPTILIDHINLNSLDNRKSNLRICTHTQNMMNRGSQKGSSSIYKGVCFANAISRLNCIKKWNANIHKDKKKYNLGYFMTEIEAAKAYDKKAKELFGEFAFLNFKDDND